MHLQESGEMYLETLYILSQKSHAVRQLDIAEYMNYSKPSVNRAIGQLIPLAGTVLGAAMVFFLKGEIKPK